VTDQLSSGPDRPPRPVTKVVAVCLGLLVVQHGTGRSQKPQHVAVSRTPAAVPTASQTLSPTVSPTARPSVGPTISQSVNVAVQAGMLGIAGPAPKGTVLLVGGPHPMVIGGSSRAFRQLPVAPGAAVSRILPVHDGYVVEVQHGELTPGQPSADIYRVRANGTATLLTRADDVVLSHDRSRVFAFHYGSSDAAPTASQRRGRLVELTLTGQVLSTRSLPEGVTPLAEISAGLLVADYPTTSDGSTQVELLDSRTLAVLQQVGEGGTVLASDEWIAWSQPSCTSDCLLTLANLTSGAHFEIPVADDFFIGSVAVSPDGTMAAVGYDGGYPGYPQGVTAPGFVEVTNLATGQRQRVPGVATAAKQAADLAWTPDSRSLAIGVGYPDQNVRRIGLWPATGGPVLVLPGKYAGGYSPSALVAL
jgi:hypothetical protein